MGKKTPVSGTLVKSGKKKAAGQTPFLTPAEAKKYKFGIMSNPRMVETKKYGTKMFVDVTLAKTSALRTWSMNDTSRDYLIDEYGTNPKKFDGKRVDWITVRQMVRNEMKEIIYAEGSVTE